MAIELSDAVADAAAGGGPSGPEKLLGLDGSTLKTWLISQIATMIVAQIVDSSPATLDTLNELAAALGDDPNFATTVTNALAGKQPLDADLTAIAALTTAGYGRSVLEVANAAALRTLAELVIGTHVEAHHANLSAFSGLAGAAGKIGYFTGSGAMALADFAPSNPLVTGRWYLPQFAGATASGSAPTANTMKGFLGFIRHPVTIESLGTRTYTGVASGNIRFAIYAADATTGWPTGAPLYGGSADISVAGSNAAITDSGPSLAIGPGWYWFFSNTDTNGGTATFQSIATGGVGQTALIGAANATDSFNATGISKAHTYGTWPTLTGAFAADSLANVVAATTPAISFLL